MSKSHQLLLFLAIESVREELKNCKDQFERLAVHERLIALYACIDTDAAIESLTDKRGIA